MPAKKGNKKVVEKKEEPKKEEPKKEAPKKEAPKKEAPKKSKVSSQEMEALRKKYRKYRKKVRECMSLKEMQHWGKVLNEEEKKKLTKEAEFRKERDELQAKLKAAAL